MRQLISLGMTRFYTEWLAKPGFGLKDVIDFWMIGLQQILGLNVLGAMVRFYYDRKSPSERASTVTSCTLAITLVAWLVCGTAFFFSESLKPLMLGSKDMVRGDDLVHVLELMFLLIPFQLSTLSGLYYLTAIQRSGLHTTIQTTKLIFEVVMNFVLIGHLDLGVEGFLMSMLAGEALTSLFLCAWMFRRLGARIQWTFLKPILAYALPLIPVGICQLALHTLDRRLLIRLTPLDEQWEITGVYGLAYKIGFMTTPMLLGPFLQIFHPWIFDIDDVVERGKHVARVGTWAVLAIGAATIGINLFGRQVTLVLDGGGDFTEAYLVIPYIAGGYVFWALYNVSAMPLLIAKRTGRLFLINALAVVVNVGLNLLLIPSMHFVGAGIATAATFAALSIMGMIASHSEARVRFEFGRLTAIMATVVASGAAGLWLDGRELAGRLAAGPTLALKAGVTLMLLWALWQLVLQKLERTRIQRWSARVLRRDR